MCLIGVYSRKPTSKARGTHSGTSPSRGDEPHLWPNELYHLPPKGSASSHQQFFAGRSSTTASCASAKGATENRGRSKDVVWRIDPLTTTETSPLEAILCSAEGRGQKGALPWADVAEWNLIGQTSTSVNGGARGSDSGSDHAHVRSVRDLVGSFLDDLLALSEVRPLCRM